MKLFSFNPLTLEKWQRFRKLKRGWCSFLVLMLIYLLTAGAELCSNSRPLVMYFQGELLFPAFRFYPEDKFNGSGRLTRPDYITLERKGDLKDAWVLWAPLRCDPYRIIPTAELQPYLRRKLRLTPVPRVIGVTLNRDLTIRQATGFDSFGVTAPAAGAKLSDYWQLPQNFSQQLEPRWAGEQTQTLTLDLEPAANHSLPKVQLVIAGSAKRPRPRTTLRLRILESHSATMAPQSWDFEPNSDVPRRNQEAFDAMPTALRQQLLDARNATGDLRQEIQWDGRKFTLQGEDEAPRFPFRPVPGHRFGIDDAGRDVFARIFYGLRIALNFGFILVLCSMAAGSFFGMLQGYAGGVTDIMGQRLIEIWSALPFLYVMILMGSIYGPGFGLLLCCYALFNWVGISHYIRAETLRLRKKPFVEAAKCLGLPGWRIALRHILPNALVPIITFFPFSLVGAIGSLAALDYLGFGLPAPTPSLGELLAQAQTQRWAWWLILYPALALFIVMLLGVFIGESIRNAFDPRRQQRLQ